MNEVHLAVISPQSALACSLSIVLIFLIGIPIFYQKRLHHLAWNWQWGHRIIGHTQPCNDMQSTVRGGGGEGAGNHHAYSSSHVYTIKLEYNIRHICFTFLFRALIIFYITVGMLDMGIYDRQKSRYKLSCLQNIAHFKSQSYPFYVSDSEYIIFCGL